jgi:hypothetical protein
MKKRTLLGGVAAAVLAITGSTVALPSAAQAAYTCKTGELCIYSDYDLRGSVLIIYGGAHNFYSDWHFYNGLAANDNASSVINKTTRTAYFTSDFDGRGIYDGWVDAGKQQNLKGRDTGHELPNDTMSWVSV